MFFSFDWFIDTFQLAGFLSLVEIRGNLDMEQVTFYDQKCICFLIWQQVFCLFWFLFFFFFRVGLLFLCLEQALFSIFA